MAGEQQMKPASELLLIVNFCMCVVVLGIGGRAMNSVIFDHGFIIGPRFDLPAHFLPAYFPMGNAAIGFFVTFSLIAGVVGAASAISGLNHVRSWTAEGYCCLGALTEMITKRYSKLRLHVRNASLRTMESFLIILSATQLFPLVSQIEEPIVRKLVQLLPAWN